MADIRTDMTYVLDPAGAGGTDLEDIIFARRGMSRNRGSGQYIQTRKSDSLVACTAAGEADAVLIAGMGDLLMITFWGPDTATGNRVPDGSYSSQGGLGAPVVGSRLYHRG